MLSSGLMLGFMTFISMLVTYMKLPAVAKYLVKKHKLLTDIFSFGFVFITLSAISKSITAIVGATLTGLLVGMALEAAGFMDEDPDLKVAVKAKVSTITDSAKHSLRTKLIKWANK